MKGDVEGKWKRRWRGGQSGRESGSGGGGASQGQRGREGHRGGGEAASVLIPPLISRTCSGSGTRIPREEREGGHRGRGG